MIRCLLFISLLIHSTLGQKSAGTPSQKWLTLNGKRPLVVARGGFSGLFPESSSFANQLALSSSLPDTVLFCNLQLTKDGAGICLTDIRLDNSTNIGLVWPKGKKTYDVNGNKVHGWFALDYTIDQLFSNISLTQGILSRPSLFDFQSPISAVEDVVGIKPAQFWLNVQYDSFYTQHKLSPTSYVQKAMRAMRINYLSSAEIGFLKTMKGKVTAKTKLIFQALGADEIEPTTNKKYSELLQDLTSIKAFATGILVPKEYIWPVQADQYLGAPSTLVADAHKQGLEVYASGFANDFFASYNYSYDPTSEYLQFVDNSKFSVDGVLTDFSPTASEAIACFANSKAVSKPVKGQALIISKNGASGIYPGCTDLAYRQALDDGADIIDCSVQMSKDGVAFCLDSADLMADTTAMTSFMSRSNTVPEIQAESGIFSFDLTWSEIQTLKPQMANVLPDFHRNPAYKNAGKLTSLAEFLDLAKTNAVSGVLINIQNAAYLASKKGLDIVGVVTAALTNATFDKQSTQQVLIQSDDTSVLSKFASVPTYKRVLLFEDKMGDAPEQPVQEIKKYADAVAVTRTAITEVSGSFTSRSTNIVAEFQKANVSVYVYVLRNEYITLAFDYFSDPILEIATFIGGAGVDGVVTEYPGTASKYLRSPCTNSDKPEYNILPVQPGALISIVPPEGQPPAPAPLPPLKLGDIVDPPLPPVANITADTAAAPNSPTIAEAQAPRSSALANAASVGLSLVAIMVLSLLFSMEC
ncbi:glycerophosphodiester phosphodiesterase GDPDL6-like [Corylus avellana]|uniref:glycerophosphodiester phosphodiesterase GDPDL6-like n=1 Tax=Corylus avellana TaxID=13451 RepID=UPI00286C7F8A|nr:glycerophosphodiester phosphodiesterase GDPDL6-like [Corylus avellana]XP_059454471.1 glycerophosphodiester phosphodiesterase GDPDL6-like [Corylus avellana]